MRFFLFGCDWVVIERESVDSGRSASNCAAVCLELYKTYLLSAVAEAMSELENRTMNTYCFSAVVG